MFFIIFSIAWIAFCVFCLFKNHNCFKNRMIILKAIFTHNLDAIENNRLFDVVSYDEPEKYEKTLWRLWDWGYKNIVPPEVFEKIAPFVNK